MLGIHVSEGLEIIKKAKINEYNVFTEPQTVMDNTVYLKGKWRWDKEGIKASFDHKERHPAIIFNTIWHQM